MSPSPNLSGQIATLVTLVEGLDRRAKEDREERKEHHANLHEALEKEQEESRRYREAVQADLANLNHAHADIAKRLAKIEPVVSGMSSLQMKITGGVIVLGFIGSIAWAAVATFWTEVFK